MFDRVLVVGPYDSRGPALWSLVRPLFEGRERAFAVRSDLPLRVSLSAVAPESAGPPPKTHVQIALTALSAELGIKVTEVLRALLTNGVRANLNSELGPDEVALVLRVLPFTAELELLVDRVPLTGHVVERTLELARVLEADLIVVDSTLAEADGLFRGLSPPILATPASADPVNEVEVRTVLLALDGSERAAGIVPVVAAVASAYGASVRIVFACEPPAPLPERALATARNMFQDQGIHAYVDGGTGASAEAVVGLAAREKGYLVAIERGAASDKAGVVLGPMAADVVRRVRGPLLLLKADEFQRGKG